MAIESIDVSSNGRWIKVPAVDVRGRFLTVQGRLVRLAVIHDEWWLPTELDDPEVFIKLLREQKSRGLRADVFTFSQKVPGSSPRYQYPMEWESVAAARTADFQAWWESLPQESRKNVRRSQKRGVTVRLHEFDDDLIRGIAEVNNDSPFRQGRPNTHYGKTLEQVRKDHESFIDRSDFFCAYFEDKIIGYLKVVYKGEVASILNLAVIASHNDKRPANALIAAAVERCAAKQAAYLTYGFFNYGNKQDSPLRQFKTRNGFEEMLTPRYYVPLTAWGNLAMRMKLHRGLLGILPPSLISLGVAARMKWYNFRNSRAGVAQC